MRTIYKFKLNNPKIVDETITKQDADGKEIRVIEKVTKDNFIDYVVAKPTISINQEAELYYESVVSECMKRGIMSQLQMRKRFLNDGGVLSEEQKKQYNDLWEKLFTLKAEFNKLNEKPDENKEKLSEITNETTSVLIELQDFEERNGGSIYDHTAENIARNRTAIWLTLHLAYQDLGNNKYKPVFGEGKFEDKLKKYEEIEKKEDMVDIEMVQRFLLITSLYYYGKASTQEEFDQILDLKDKKDKKIKEFEKEENVTP